MLASSRAAQFNSGVSNLTRCYMQRQKAARISFNIEGQLLAVVLHLKLTRVLH